MRHTLHIRAMLAACATVAALRLDGYNRMPDNFGLTERASQ